MKVQAKWNNQIIAESDETVVVEGNHYFPASSVEEKFLKSSETHTTCPYKGVASYYSIDVNGKINQDAAWYYPQTKQGFEKIAGYVAFWRGVEVTSLG